MSYFSFLLILIYKINTDYKLVLEKKKGDQERKVTKQNLETVDRMAEFIGYHNHIQRA